jgi:hypothetical protein
MSWKKKTKMSNKKVKVVVINRPAKVTAINQPAKVLVGINPPLLILSKLQKWQQNIEVISKFIEKTGNRHNVRTKLFEILFSYLSQIKLQLSVPAENKLHLKLMKVLGFFLYFYVYSIISKNHETIICLIDSLIDYDLKKDTEIEKWEGNVVNGALGMKRDANLQSIEFLHSYEDVKAVLIGS